MKLILKMIVIENAKYIKNIILAPKFRCNDR